MKLYAAQTSPYARKVRVLIAEKRAGARVELVLIDPWSDPAALHQAVPSGKVPALVTDEGWALGESWAIADYLDSVLPGPRLLAPDGPERWQALRRSALAQGLMDAVFAAVIEGRRPAGERSPGWVERQKAAIGRSLPVLEAMEPPALFDLGAISLACALDYLDFRHADLDWRAGCPVLATWFAAVDQRPSMRITDPR
ncbi:glutathione S-transferase [Niveispirillum sp. SYP-B3756]|uniref:glutathione S-transferase N-terminal domain-containing protein n=1 Tax=Niveispirillum sp. SYP-B3756 TaxID=2662178 RepID=UPI001291D39A|nr:glutathione S-transferase N-terminal domain-containing protein [Niveispirillum sp. SYP-B3756]MQP65779.1 glutathione S-transferase [Niveispirillum sp. SYP-B3756]